jgi:hypothetical protein
MVGGGKRRELPKAFLPKSALVLVHAQCPGSLYGHGENGVHGQHALHGVFRPPIAFAAVGTIDVVFTVGVQPDVRIGAEKLRVAAYDGITEFFKIRAVAAELIVFQ